MSVVAPDAVAFAPRGALAALACFGVVALAIVVMFAPMQRATFAINDDYRIVTWAMRPSAPGWTTRLVESISNDGGRWRPGFWALWGLEATLARDRPSVWHLDRLIVALAAAAALFRAASTALGAPWAALVTLLLFCGFHNEVWMRLVVQEAFATPVALAGTAIIAGRLRAGPCGPWALWPGLALVAASGTIKESFVPLLPAALVIVMLLERQRRRWRSDAVDGGAMPLQAPWQPRDRRALAMLLAVTAMEAFFVAHTRWAQGSVYGGTFTISGMAATAVRHSWWITKDSGWVAPVAAAALVLARSQGARAVLSFAGLLAAAAATLLAPQWILYASDPLESRYLLPGHFFACFAAALGLWVLETRRARALMVASGLALAWFAGKWVLRDHEVATRRAAETHAYQDAIAAAADLHRQGGRPFVFRTDDPWDYEPIHAAWTFLHYRLGEPPRAFLVASSTRPSRSQALNERLAKGLARQSAEGDARFAPLARLDRGEGCIELTFRARPARAWCEMRVQIPAPE